LNSFVETLCTQARAAEKLPVLERKLEGRRLLGVSREFAQDFAGKGIRLLNRFYFIAKKIKPYHVVTAWRNYFDNGLLLKVAGCLML
jgi:hypothetical protein